jgi:hypothetical protein
MYQSAIAALVLAFATHGGGMQTGSLSKSDRAALTASCGGDYAIFCGDLAPDGSEVQACFRKNLADLTPACRAEIGRSEKSGKKD